MSYLARLSRLIDNAIARKRNEERGRQDLQQREVEALEKIALALSSTEQREAK